MNGFLEMVTQARVEDFVTEMDTEFDQEIDSDRAEIVMPLFREILVTFDFDGTEHPAEYGIEEVTRAVATMYMLLQIGSPATVSMLGRDLIIAAVTFNEAIEPIILKLREEILGEQRQGE